MKINWKPAGALQYVLIFAKIILDCKINKTTQVWCFYAISQMNENSILLFYYIYFLFVLKLSDISKGKIMLSSIFWAPISSNKPLINEHVLESGIDESKCKFDIFLLKLCSSKIRKLFITITIDILTDCYFFRAIWINFLDWSKVYIKKGIFRLTS